MRPASYHNAVLRVKKVNNHAKIKVHLGASAMRTTQIGAEIDLYSGTPSFEMIEIPSAAFTAQGERFITFELTETIRRRAVSASRSIRSISAP